MKPSSFRESVQKVVKAIPKGQVLTYGEVALRAGCPGAARAVGTIMAGNHDPEIPCHRVVKSGGQLGEYNRTGGTAAKANLLRQEGVAISVMDRWSR